MSALKSEVALALRRAVLAIQPGQQIHVATHGEPQRAVSTAVRAYAKRKGKAVSLIFGPDGVILDCLTAPRERRVYDFHTWRVGETRKLEIPEAEHQNVRTAAHQWSVKNGAKLACNKIDSRTIAVTRLDPNAPDLALARAHAKRRANGRGMRFPFDALQAVGQSFFVPLHEDPTGSALRALARYYAARLGAKFKVTYTGDDVPPAQRGYYVLRIA